MVGNLIKTNIKHNNSRRGIFTVPKNYKPIYAAGLEVPVNTPPEIRAIAEDINEVFKTKTTQENYVRFFHNLLWYEETIVRSHLKKYNMPGVCLDGFRNGDSLKLVVPGLAEKRPSLLMGDLLFVQPQNADCIFEAVITEIRENCIIIRGFDDRFWKYHGQKKKFDIRFFMSRISLERMHSAVDTVLKAGQRSRVFPETIVRRRPIPEPRPIRTYYNHLIQENPEQRLAVEHIVSATSGLAPYLLHGPPGTGKTVTIVEAMLQLVKQNTTNRIMVCTDSNMAADHVATILIKYARHFTPELLLRANSKFRCWETLPECLAKYSNGTDYKTYTNVTVDEFSSHRIVVTTLSHAAKFAEQFKREENKLPITHLFIDEAAQASEPACLIPVCGLLRPRGALVLAGDPLQLGPVVVSHSARALGLGMSLMERLMTSCPLYGTEGTFDANYTVMLRNNFRSDADILLIPNQLFYKGQLRAFAAKDEISDKDILGQNNTSGAIVFHGVLSQEEKTGNSPSYFNNMEIEIVQMYVTFLLNDHQVSPDDIGVVTPYIRQVYKIKSWLQKQGLPKVEVGTVEAFQGKEKRVIIVSTVRASSDHLQHDAKYKLGFLVDDKRFNVALTRAKAKAIIIGNPLCLENDVKWRTYMQRCRELGTYVGFDPNA